MIARRVALLMTLAGCGQVIGLRDLGVEAPTADGGPSATPDADVGLGATPDAGSDAMPDTGACTTTPAGQWSGPFTASAGYNPGTGIAQAEFKQACDVLSGTLSFDACFADGKVLANIDDGGLDGIVTAGTIVMALKGTVTTPYKMQGTFSINQSTPLGTCYGMTGSFVLDRK